jgi:hypothetical protein
MGELEIMCLVECDGGLDFKNQDLAHSLPSTVTLLPLVGKVADIKWFYSTRLETRTKECNKHASRRVKKT